MARMEKGNVHSTHIIKLKNAGALSDLEHAIVGLAQFDGRRPPKYSSRGSFWRSKHLQLLTCNFPSFTTFFENFV